MITLRHILLSSLLLLSASIAHANEPSSTCPDSQKNQVAVCKNPYELVQTAAKQTFARMKREQALIQADPNHLKVIMEESLLPHIDYKYAAFVTLGKYARQYAKDRKKLAEFVTQFKIYLISTYANALSYYDDQLVEFEPAKEITNERVVTIRARIIDDVRPVINVAFKIRKDRKTNEWMAYDMVAEGISLLNAKRAEFESLLQAEGIDAVISLMQQKSSEDIVLKSSTSQAPTGI